MSAYCLVLHANAFVCMYTKLSLSFSKSLQMYSLALVMLLADCGYTFQLCISLQELHATYCIM